jgi:hypothetical protein
MPIEDIKRSWEGDSVKASGNEPTTKDVTAITMHKASKVKSPSMVASCRKRFARVPEFYKVSIMAQTQRN